MPQPDTAAVRQHSEHVKLGKLEKLGNPLGVKLGSLGGKMGKLGKRGKLGGLKGIGGLGNLGKGQYPLVAASVFFRQLRSLSSHITICMILTISGFLYQPHLHHCRYLPSCGCPTQTPLPLLQQKDMT